MYIALNGIINPLGITERRQNLEREEEGGYYQQIRCKRGGKCGGSSESHHHTINKD